MRKIYLDMKYTTGIPGAYKFPADELAGASGMNLGNLVFRHALKFIVSELSEYDPTIGPEFKTIAENEKIGHIILSCANWLGTSEQDERFNEGRANMIESAGCPVTAFGLGAQSPKMKTRGKVVLGPKTLRLAKVISERSAQISVRDEFTRETLESAGIDNAVVTGCPSGFINGDPKLGEHLEEKALALSTELKSWNEVRSSISEASGGHSISGKVLNRQMRMLDETPAFYVIQTPILLPFQLGERSKIPNSYREDNPFMSKSGHLTRTLKAKTLHFSDVDAWLDFSRTCDVSFGMRIHGSMVPLQSGTPSILVAHDSRTVGLADSMGVPWISPERFLEVIEEPPRVLLSEFGEKINRYDANRAKRAQLMVDLLVKNGLTPTSDLRRLTQSTEISEKKTSTS